MWKPFFIILYIEVFSTLGFLLCLQSICMYGKLFIMLFILLHLLWVLSEIFFNQTDQSLFTM